MSTYCIGDIHGCYDEFMALLEKINFNENSDTLLCTGDLIGRGPLPLETMKFILQHKARFHCVLGNHDLNFLAVAAGLRASRPQDNLDVLLKSELLPEILDYFVHGSLLYLDEDKGIALTHAGLNPQYDLKLARKLSKEVSKVLQDPLRRDVLLHNMYQDFPTHYSEEDMGLPRWRFALNSFTRMRLVYQDLHLDYGHSSTTVEDAEQEALYPWFKYRSQPKLKGKPYTIVFGHWAALNAKCNVPYIKALDTGCVWGGTLTCWHVEKDKLTSVKAKEHQVPKKK